MKRTAPQMISKIIVEDCQQPCAAIAPRGELMKKTVGAKDRILKQVLGVIRIAGEAKSCGIDRVQMRQRDRLESLACGRRIRWSGPHKTLAEHSTG